MSRPPRVPALARSHQKVVSIHLSNSVEISDSDEEEEGRKGEGEKMVGTRVGGSDKG